MKMPVFSFMLLITSTCFANNPEGTSGNYPQIDYATASITLVHDYSETVRPTINITEDLTSTTLDIYITHAILFDAQANECPGAVNWIIPDCISDLGMNTPMIPLYEYVRDMPENVVDMRATVTETDYKDFNYRMCAHPLSIEDGSASNRHIEPYEGFWPTGISPKSYVQSEGIQPDGNERGKRISTIIPLAQYDYEHEVVRAYTHIKVRVDYLTEESATAEVEVAETPARYFNMQGIEVTDPKVGEIYIEWQGHTARKRRF